MYFSNSYFDFLLSRDLVDELLTGAPSMEYQKVTRG
jgi:hypothetical protein